MNAKVWWENFRKLYRSLKVERFELIQRSGLEQAQWARLERGEGSPTDDVVRKIKSALVEALSAAGREMPEALNNLPDSIASSMTPIQIQEWFESIVNRELGFRRERPQIRHVSNNQIQYTIRNCETIAIGADQNYRRTINFPQRLHRFIDEHDRQPTALWYPSAGPDVRPMVFFSNGFQELVRKPRPSTNIIPNKPDLFIFTSLPFSLTEHYSSRSSRKPSVLFEHGSTILCIEDVEELYMDREKHPFVKGYATFGKDPRTEGAPDGLWMTLRLRSHMHSNLNEKIQLLYLFHENVHFWDEWIIGGGLFGSAKLKLETLVFSREGIALGGCERSSLVHWLEMPTDIQREFCPRYIVVENGLAKRRLLEASEEQGFTLDEVAPYIYELHNGRNDTVYQITW